jgi:hypothetical protein
VSMSLRRGCGKLQPRKANRTSPEFDEGHIFMVGKSWMQVAWAKPGHLPAGALLKESFLLSELGGV